MAELMISDNDLIRALQAALETGAQESDGALTTAELVKVLGMNDDKVRMELAKLKAKGKLMIIRRKIEALDGRIMWISAYRLKSED